ncbi:MAG: hypothetical protein E6R07_14750 [Nevskiaceae bacterium]|nr:MAG: hypothetical protein E6R07_14750 [Nevskiaceae bacterium]
MSSRFFESLVRGCGTLLALTGAWLTFVVPAQAQQEPPTRSCNWILSVPASGDAANWGWPDEGAKYAIGVFTIPNGGYIELKGKFPHARYLSFTNYDPRMKAVDALQDFNIVPDSGSVNPSVVGGDRNAVNRSYTVKMVNATVPSGLRAPNTIYTTSQDGSRTSGPLGLILLRSYVPDVGRDATGDVGWPVVTSVSADGTRSAPQDCPTITLPLAATPLLAGLSLPLAFPQIDFGGYNPPVWFKSWNNVVELYINSLFGPAIEPASIPLDQLAQNVPLAGVGENPAAKYMMTAFNQTYGQVLVLTGKAPTYPPTYKGEPVMRDAQMRYWSFCSYIDTTMYLGCRHDDQIPLDADGFYHIMVSAAANRPTNAREECGFAWIPAAPRSIIAVRNILANPGFEHAINNIVEHGSEERVLGDYYPRGTYYASPTDAEKLGCNPPQTAASGSVGDKGGGGSLDWLALMGLMLLLSAKRQLKRTMRVRNSQITAQLRWVYPAECLKVASLSTSQGDAGI